MNQALAQYLSTHFLLSESGANSFHGVYRNYEVNVIFYPRVRFPLRCFISTHLDEAKANSIFAMMGEEKKPRTQYRAEVVCFGIAYQPLRGEELPYTFFQAIEESITLLERANAPDYSHCPFSGDPIDESSSRTCRISDMRVRMNESSIEAYQKELEDATKAYENAPDHPIAGFFGALLAAMIGFGVAYFLLYFLGFGAIGGFIAASLGVTLYMAFHGKPRLRILPLVGLLSLTAILTADLLYYFLIAFSSFSELSRVEALSAAFRDPTYLASFLFDIVSSLISVGIGVFLGYLNLRKHLFKPPKILY